MNKTNFKVGDDGKTLTMERIFNAPKAKLWEAYTTADALAKWFGPVGWETEVPHLDFTEGGEWRYIMKCVDERQTDWFGKTSAGKTVFTQINPEDSFEYTDYFTDNDGNIDQSMPASHSQIYFKENADKSTTVTVVTTYATAEELKQVLDMGMEQGYAETLDKLEAFVAS